MAIFTNGVFPAGGEAGDGGGIIQIKQTLKRDVSSFGDSGRNSFIDSGIDVTITPSDNSNKILLYWSIYFGLSTQENIGLAIYANDSIINDFRATGAGSNQQRGGTQSYVDGGSYGGLNTGFYVDSPNTTSAIKYTPYIMYLRNGNANFYINRNENDQIESYRGRFCSTFTAMEISS